MNDKKYIFENVDQLDIFSLQSGSHIILYDAFRTPPHLFLCIDGSVFTLNISGVKFYRTIDAFLKLIQSKNKPIVGIELHSSNNILNFSEILTIFKQFQFASTDKTCLQPITSYLSERFLISFDPNSVIFDVVNALNEHNLITKTYTFNIEGKALDRRIILDKYDAEIVKSHLLSIV
jgi:hypothetical protein